MINQKKILFISNSRLGDAIFTTSILNYLLSKYPHAIVTVATGVVAVPIFDAIPNVIKIIPIEKQKYGLHWFNLWKKVKDTKWDIIVDFRHSIISRFLTAHQKYYKVNKAYKNAHVSKRVASILNLKEGETPFPRIWLSSAHQNKADMILEKDQVYVTIAPTANWPCKIWPIENFIALTNLIKEIPGFEDAKFIVTAAPNEYDLCMPLLSYLGTNGKELIYDVDLLTVAACMKRSKLFIGNDSGLTHLAAAVGTPAVGLFGPTRDDLYAPFGHNKTLTVRTKESYEELISTIKTSRRDATACLMHSLTPEHVYSQIRNQLFNLRI